MSTNFKTLKLGEISPVDLDLPGRSRIRMEKLVDEVSRKGLLQQFVGDYCLPRILVTKNRYFFFDHFIFFATLSKRYPLLEVQFALIPDRKATLSSLRARIVRQIQVESLVSPDGVEVFSFEKANASRNILTRASYAAILGRKPNSLNYYDRQYRQKNPQNSVPIKKINRDEALKGVSPPPTHATGS